MADRELKAKRNKRRNDRKKLEKQAKLTYMISDRLNKFLADKRRLTKRELKKRYGLGRPGKNFVRRENA
jgi:hypothetical protein